jgi:hypothetical protein
VIADVLGNKALPFASGEKFIIKISSFCAKKISGHGRGF